MQRRRCNKVLRVKKDNGEWCEEEEEIKECFVEFYKGLFKTEGVRNWGSVLDSVPKLVTNEMNKELIREVTGEEISEAVFQMGKYKAPGPDGFNGVFFQRYWSIVKEDVIDAVKGFFRSGYMLRELNKTEIVLIPKVKNPESVSQFRPISLCNFVYKIISKVMVNRLKPYLGELISENQSAFVAGRQIHDNILIAQEVFHYMRLKKKSKKYEVALKIDMNKAYDRVEWDFLEEVMGRLGFNDIWINWIMECVKTVSYSLIINGKSSCSFLPSRGIRQGDPLSPYLFLFVVDVLSRSLQIGIQNDFISGIKLGRHCPVLSHLLFADDSLFFLRAEVENCRRAIKIIEDYCQASGQLVNRDKSCVVFTANVPEEWRRKIEGVIGVRRGSNTGTYLGIPSFWGKTRCEAMSYVKDKVLMKLKSWKQQTLSQGGKEVLIKAVAGAIPTYTMACFKIPKKICREMNSAIAKFWWGQKEEEEKIHWKSWMKMTMTKSMGGMGFKDLEVFNTALLGKQAWRMISEPEALWVKILKGIYFHDKSVLEAKRGARASWAWSSLIEGRDFIKEKLVWQVLDGRSLSIWEDRWVMGLKGKKLRNPGLNDQNIPENVVELIDKEKGVWNLTAIEEWISEEEKLAIEVMPLGEKEGKDELIWPYNCQGEYTAKSGYQVLKQEKEKGERGRASSSHQIDKRIWRVIWATNVPSKVRIFLWKLVVEAVPCCYKLWQKKIKNSPVCPICLSTEETIEHMLFFCEWTRGIWFATGVGIRIDRGTVTRFDNWLLKIVESVQKEKEIREKLMIQIAFTCWMIWKERCAVVFNNKKIQMEKVVEKIRAAVREVERNNLTDENGQNKGSGSSKEEVQWRKPEKGWIKINCDGGFKAETRKAGFGVVVRNEEGALIDGCCGMVKADNALLTEAMAVREGVKLAIAKGYQRVVIEVDSKVIHSEISKQERVKQRKIWPIVRDIKHMLKQISEKKVELVRRNANCVADWIAKEAMKGMSGFGWIRQPPSSLVYILDKDGLPAPH